MSYQQKKIGITRSDAMITATSVTTNSTDNFILDRYVLKNSFI